MDALYVINYVVNRGITKKTGKVFAFFADLKAAFDKVNRIKLQEMLRKVGIEEKLRKRIIETYKETKNMARIGERKSEEFWTRKGLRQGCPMNPSPMLFNIYIMDLEEEMRKEQIEGVVIGKEKIWTISYAYEVVLLAENIWEEKICC